MREIVIDANVVVKWFIEEKDSDKAILLRDKYIDGKIKFFVPPLLYFEVLNALKYSQLFEPRELRDAGESLENYGFKVITIKNEIRNHMIKVAVDYDLSIYDASYIGLSIGLEKIFCTADEKIIKKLPSALKKKVKSLIEI
ncbi:MAG: type II toxin-antitoxin system VapC family toxin [Promethearchaeia archaeon]